MRALLLFLFLPVALALNSLQAGHVFDVNIFVAEPLAGTTWLVLYGQIEPIDIKPSWTYYATPFAKVENTQANTAEKAELNLIRSSIGYPAASEPNNWYVVIAPSKEVNLYDLSSTCDTNVDLLISGTFCDTCLPSATYSEEVNIAVNGRDYCAYKALVYNGVPVFLLAWQETPVYLSPITTFQLEGNTYNFALLLSVQDDLYLYLARMYVYCGDGVCDPGEEDCSDCISLLLTVSPDYQEVNVGETASYTLEVKNEGNVEVNVELSVKQLSSGEGAVCSLPTTSLSLSPQSSHSMTLTCASSQAGSFSFRVEGNVSGIIVPSNVFYLVVRSAEEEGGGGGGGGAPPPEENVAQEENLAVIRTPRGIIIPSLGCLSYLYVFSPDELELGLGEEKNVTVVVQNAGTCEENIAFWVEGVDANFYRLYEQNFHLAPKRSKSLEITFIGAKKGIYTVYLVAKGYYTSKRKMVLRITGERVQERGCTSSVMILSPDVVEVVEGREINVVAEVVNEGDCFERVRLSLYRETESGPVLVDGRRTVLAPGERFNYEPPRLAAGQYRLVVEAGGLKKEVSIVVRPQSAVSSALAELVVRARLVLLVLALLVILGAISYLRRRYLS